MSDGFMNVWIVIKDVRDDFSEIIAVYDSENDASLHTKRLNENYYSDDRVYFYECHSVFDELAPDK